MASQYAEWFTRISHDRDLFFLDPTELTTLQSYLEGTLPLQDTVSSLTAPTTPQWHSTQSSRVWAMLLSIAEDYGEAHDCIIALIEALFSRPKPSQPNEQDWPGEKEFGFPRCWRDIHDCFYVAKVGTLEEMLWEIQAMDELHGSTRDAANGAVKNEEDS
ncbi:hypothetical protein APSETT444_007595 [Aspergillus pseudonomiae]